MESCFQVNNTTQFVFRTRQRCRGAVLFSTKASYLTRRTVVWQICALGSSVDFREMSRLLAHRVRMLAIEPSAPASRSGCLLAPFCWHLLRCCRLTRSLSRHTICPVRVSVFAHSSMRRHRMERLMLSCKPAGHRVPQECCRCLFLTRACMLPELLRPLSASFFASEDHQTPLTS